MMKRSGCWLVAVAVMIACGGPSSGPEQQQEPAFQVEELPSDDLLASLTGSWTGDLDGMVERRAIRAMVVYNSTNFFFDEEARARGISHEFLNLWDRCDPRLKQDLVVRLLDTVLIHQDRLPPKVCHA